MRSAQCGQHGLLTFQRGGALVRFRRQLLVFLLASVQGLVFADQTFAPVVELGRLFFQFARVALQLLELMIHFESTLLQLLLALFQ